MFDTKFTVEFWIKPVNDGSLNHQIGGLMQVDEDYLMMKLSNGLKLSVELSFEAYEDSVSIEQEWTNVSFFPFKID